MDRDEGRFTAVQRHCRSPNLVNCGWTSKHASRRGGSKRNDHRGFDDRAFKVLPPTATVDLVGIGPLVQPPLASHLVFEVLHGIGDEHGFSIDARIGESLIQNPTGWTDERQARKVLVITRLLADQHHRSLFRALPRHRLGRVFVKRTAPTLILCDPQRRQCSDNGRVIAHS